MMPGSDYAALAEENRRLRTELAAAKAVAMPKPKRRPSRWWIAPVGVILGITAAFLLALWPEDAPKPDKRTTACYFVRHRLHEEQEKFVEPWERWHVFKSMYEGADNSEVDAEGAPFKTKEDAWSVIQRWKLTPCR